MDPTSPGILQQMLRLLEAALQPSAAAIRGQLTFWYTLFIFLDVVHLGWVALRGGPVGAGLLRLLVRSSLVIWGLQHYGAVFEGAIRTMVRLGLAAAGDTLTVAQFLDPGAWLLLGFQAGKGLLGMFQASSGLLNLPLGLAWGFAWLAYMAAFAVMGLNILIWQVEALLAAVWGMVLVPTLAYQGTAWMGQGALSFIVNTAVKFGLGALLASTVWRFNTLLTVPTQVTIEGAVIMLCGAWTLALMFFLVNKMASGLVSGLPSLTAGHVLGGALATAAGVTSVGAGTIAVGAGLGAAGAYSGRAGLELARQVSASFTAAHRPNTGAAGRLAALTAARDAALQAGTAPPSMAARLGGVATSQAQRSLREMVDWSRYVGSDHPRGGVHR